MSDKELFHAAIRDLAAINEFLGLDPDDGGAEPIIAAIGELKEKCAEFERDVQDCLRAAIREPAGNPLDKAHRANMERNRVFAKDLMLEPLSHSDIATVEQAGECMMEMADYCDRMRVELERANRKPRCVARVEVFGKDWKLHYMDLPVGVHDLYAESYTYSDGVPNGTKLSEGER